MEESKNKPVKKAKEIGEIIFHKKVARLLILLLQENKWTLSKLGRESGLSFPYVTEMVKDFEKDGLVLTSKGKKMRSVSLTEKGTVVASKLNETFTLIYEKPSNEIIEKVENKESEMKN